MFLNEIGQCHHESKTRYEGAIVDAERLAEEAGTVEHKHK